jgi:hypothetical protein
MDLCKKLYMMNNNLIQNSSFFESKNKWLNNKINSLVCIKTAYLISNIRLKHYLYWKQSVNKYS